MISQECGQEFAQLNDEEYEATNESEPRSLVAQLCRAALNPSRDEIPELQRVRVHLVNCSLCIVRLPRYRCVFGDVLVIWREQIVDVSEQLTRAGIDLLKSGFSRFGFVVGGNGGAKTGGNRRVLGNSQVLVIFVVGGITFEEVRSRKTSVLERFAVLRDGWLAGFGGHARY